MINQTQIPTAQQLYELTELYYAAPLAAYEGALQLAVKQLQQVLSAFTIAFAEIHTAGSERQAHSGMRHVFMPTERNAQ